jgi:DNA-binding transcriptional LysR family regulator
MDLNLLPVFRLVAQTRSFSDAARQLKLPRSSVSRSIAALEAQVGAQLFLRTTRQVSLTSAGAALHEKLAQPLEAVRAALGAVSELEKQPTGELRITAPNDLGVTWLPGVIAGFRQRYPDVRFDVRLSSRVLDLAAEGIDLALRVAADKLPDSDLVARRLTTLEMQLYASPRYLARRGTPRTLEEATEHDWVLFRHRQPAGLVLPPERQRMVADDLLFALQAVKNGAGVAALPTFLARDDVASGELVRVLPRFSQATGTLWAMHPRVSHLPARTRLFRAWVEEVLAAAPLTPPAL